MRERLTQSKRWVVKVGSSLLTNDGRGLDTDRIEQWTTQLAKLMGDDCQLVLVSSGSIAEGLVRLGWTQRPTVIHELQAAAAVGQMGLIQAYEAAFKRQGRQTAQILLTHEDLADRRRYLNARSTLKALIDHDVMPIVNENDTVTTDEIRLGDNDTLAALVCNLIDADVLVLLTDQEGLFDKDPRRHSDAKLLERANASDPSVQKLAGPSGTMLGSGGMLTKILAAERAAQSGTTTIIASGREPDVLLKLRRGEGIGTMLTSDQVPRVARKQWLANHLRVAGQLQLDSGACRVLREKGSSLLAVGVSECVGDFNRGELVACVDENQKVIGKGLINYNATDTRKLIGHASDKYMDLLGYTHGPELIHRDNLIVERSGAAVSDDAQKP